MTKLYNELNKADVNVTKFIVISWRVEYVIAYTMPPA